MHEGDPLIAFVGKRPLPLAHARGRPLHCMLGQKDGCGADHDTELQRGAAPDLWQGGLGHNPLQRGAAPDLQLTHNANFRN